MRLPRRLNSRSTGMVVNCELKLRKWPPTEGTPGSCGLDFWWSTASVRWVATYLNAVPATLALSDGIRRLSIRLYVRRLPLGLKLASTYPYGELEGDVSLLTPQGARAISKTLRYHRIIRAEIGLTDETWARAISDVQAWTPSQLDSGLTRHVLGLNGEVLSGQEPLGWLNRKLRWAINRARRDGCQVRLATSGDAETVQRIYAETMRAKGAAINYGVDRFRGILQELMPLGRGKILMGYLQGVPVGMAAFVDGRASRHLLQLAVVPEAQSSRLSDLLIYECVQDAMASGKKYFDFMASHDYDKGLMEFKEKWGSVGEQIHTLVLPGLPGLGRVLNLARIANNRWGVYRAC